MHQTIVVKTEEQSAFHQQAEQAHTNRRAILTDSELHQLNNQTTSHRQLMTNSSNRMTLDTTTSTDQKTAAGSEGSLLLAAKVGGNCCAGCNELIKDKFIFNVIDLNWHQECVQCSDCFKKLNEKCYTFEGKLYCRLDYWRRFGPKCFACKELIEDSELVQKVRSSGKGFQQQQPNGGLQIYHLECFTCSDCNRQLKQGEQMHLVDNGKRLLCKQDYLSSMSAPTKANGTQFNQAANFYSPEQAVEGGRQQQQAQIKQEDMKPTSKLGQLEELGDENELDEEENELDSDEVDEDDDGDSTTAADESGAFGANGQPNNSFGRNATGKAHQQLSNSSDCGDDLLDANGKRRGPRTTIKPKQLDTLRRAFETAPKPSRHIREQLASETGLNMRVIQVWFQNRRSKERRMKNSNGSARRNFFRSSSRRLRVAAVPGTPTPGQQQQQQSLIAGARPANLVGKTKQQQQQQQQGQQQMSPAEAGLQGPDASQQMLGNPQQQQQASHHHSPSEFGGSSSGGFTYFSDSSNQGAEAFAINPSGQPNQQQQYLAQQQPDPTLMALESPNSASNQMMAQQQQQQPNQAQSRQQQYGHHQLMKNTPPPPPQAQQQLYLSGPPQMMLGGGLPAPQQQQPPPPPQQMHPQQPGAGLNPVMNHHQLHLANHPGAQQQSVVQW